MMDLRAPGLKASPRPILVVDDDPVIREAMHELLELEGYPVALASDGEDALRRLRLGLDPCLIVLDVSMPGKDGFQFRAEQLADTRFASIPTVVWSAQPGPQLDLVRRFGTTVLRKGVDFETLLGCIEAQRRKE
jgi:two-component system, chemotaxis family, chemotaxis protein CheY